MTSEKKDTKVQAEVTILGESLVIIGNQSLEYIRSMVRYVNERLTELAQAYPRMSRNKILALGVMNLADELVKANQEVEMLQAEIERMKQERQDMQFALERTHKLAQHYQTQYEELALSLEEEEEETM